MQALTGMVMKPRGQFKKGKKWLNVQQRVVPVVEKLIQSYREIFEDEFKRAKEDAGERLEGRETRTQKERQLKASAWYYVTYAEDRRPDRSTRKRRRQRKEWPLLLSFAWIPFDVLCDIKRQISSPKHSERQ